MNRSMRRWFRRYGGGAVAGLVLASALTWWIFFRTDPTPPQPKIWTLFLLDISLSTWSGSPDDSVSLIRTGYLRNLEAVLERDEGSLYAFDVIDRNPLAHGYLTQYEAVSCEGKSYLDCNAERELAKEGFLGSVRSRLSSKQAGTDIKGGLYLAERFFNSDNSGACHRLIVFSDMLLRKDKVNLASPSTWEEPYSLLDLYEKVGSAPSLPGVDVYLVGIGINGAGDFSHSIELEQFWTFYFEQSGAQVRSSLATLPSNLPYPCGQEAG